MSETQHKVNAEVEIAVLNRDIMHINTTLARMEGKFDSAMLNFVTIDKLVDAQKAADATHAAMEEKCAEKDKQQDEAIKKLEDWNTWAVRIVLGAIILAVVTLVLKSNHAF